MTENINPSRNPENTHERHPVEAQPTCKNCPLYEKGMPDMLKTEGYCNMNLCQEKVLRKARNDYYRKY